tara:strand:+ start:798 stop:1628 length:831 start_codon:yes stop_codon:yes gene_type:complete
VADNNLFPRRSDIFKGSTLDIRDTLARVSLDTLYQVTFSFGKSDIWLENRGRSEAPGKNRTQGTDFKRKMSLLCTQAEIPGTSYTTDLAVGHHQGIQESFPNLRNFPPLNLTFYCDADMVILEVLEKWMTYINPIQKRKRDYAAYTRFNYPEDYKEILHVTKFERDSFSQKKSDYKSAVVHYEFINIWPTDFTSMRVAYGEPNVLQCSIQFAYDRFFTSFDGLEGQVPINTATGLINSNDSVEGGYTISKEYLNATGQLVRADNAQYGDTFPPGSF